MRNKRVLALVLSLWPILTGTLRLYVWKRLSNRRTSRWRAAADDIKLFGTVTWWWNRLERLYLLEKVRYLVKRTSLLHKSVNNRAIMFNDVVTCGWFYKHFTLVTYGISKITCAIVTGMQSAPAYFATAVNYTCKMFMKLTPEHRP
jgi:hypothetical protein